MPTAGWHKSISRPGNVNQIFALKIANYDRIESVYSWRKSADDKFLAAIDAQLGPGTGAFSWFIKAVFAFGDDTFKPLLPDGSKHGTGRNIELLGNANRRTRVEH